MAYNYDILIQKQMNRILQQQYRGEKQRKAASSLTEALRKHGKEGFSKFNAQDRQRFVKEIESTYGKRELKKALGTDFGTYVNDLVTLTQGKFESKYQGKIKDKDFEAQEILSRGYERILTPRKYDRPGRPPLTPVEKAKRDREKEKKEQKEKEKALRKRKKKDPTVDETAPYGRKEDGTPREKPGRKTDEERKLREKEKQRQEEIKELIENRPLPDEFTEPEIKKPEIPEPEAPEYGPNPDDYKIDPEDFKPIHGPEEYERKPEDFIDPTEEFKPEGEPEPEEKEPELPKLEDIPLEDLIEPGKEPIEAQPLVIQTPEQESDPDLDLEKAIGRRASKSRIATENWFRCARIEFGLNIARLPVLIDLATRVANKDPRLLFTPQTEIELWYRHYGYAKADVLIDDLEAVSGLKASTDIQGYEDIEDRNRKIRRWYAKRLRYNIREELKEVYGKEELEKEVRKRMRELGYEY